MKIADWHLTTRPPAADTAPITLRPIRETPHPRPAPQTTVPGRFFKKRRRTLSIAVLLAALSIMSFLMTRLIVPGGATGPEIFRLILMLLLALFLGLGKNWARWVTVVLTGLGALGALLAGAMVFMAGSSAENTVMAVCMLAMTGLYGSIAVFLATSKGVSREIRRASRSIP